MEQESYQRCWIEGKEVNCNAVDVSLPIVGMKHWAYRAISEAVKFIINRNR